jgi:hypothetical protein
MDSTSFVIDLLTIVGTGALTKIGENITDAFPTKISKLVDLIQCKLPLSQTAKSLAAGEELDPRQTTIDVEPLAQDPEINELLAQIKDLITKNSELKAELDATVLKARKNIQTNRDRSQGYMFNEKVEAGNIGGNHTHHHYHETNPD